MADKSADRDNVKIVVMNSFPLKKMSGATEKHLMDIINVIKDNNEVIFLSISKTTTENRFQGYKQYEIEGGHFVEIIVEKSPLWMGVDLGLLMLLGYRPSVNKANNSRALLKKLLELSPDYIILVGHLFSGLIINYKKAGGKALVIGLEDSVNQFFSNLEMEGGERSIVANAIGRLFRRIIRDRYIKYNFFQYERLLKVCDAIVTPIKEHQQDVQKAFPDMKDKVFVIQAHYFSKLGRFRPKKRVGKLLFMGGYLYSPNAEAAKLIETVIAPKMKDMKFLICGKDCPRLTRGNVYYLGTVDDINKLINEVDVCLSPLFSGVGPRAKVFDYLVNRKAVIGTPRSFKGYAIKDGYNAIVENNINNYAKRITELERNHGLFEAIQKNSISALKGCSKMEVKEKWDALFKEIKQRRLNNNGSAP